MLAEVEVTHEVRVARLVAAVDVGIAVNPDGVVNQIEGGCIQASSWTLKEAWKPGVAASIPTVCEYFRHLPDYRVVDAECS